MTDEELRERIVLHRKAWELYSKAQQHEMDELVDVYGTVEDPVNPGFFVLDRAHRIMKGLCRLDRSYTRIQIQVMRQLLESLAAWVGADSEHLEWR